LLKGKLIAIMSLRRRSSSSNVYYQRQQQQHLEEDDRQRLLNSKDVIIKSSSPSGASCSLGNTSEGWEVRIDETGLVEFNDEFIPNDTRLAERMRAVKNLRFTDTRPNEEALIKAYEEKGVRLSPNTNLKNKFILQQLIDTYNQLKANKIKDEQMAAVKALLARYKILRGVNRLIGVSNAELLAEADVKPLPQSLLDVYLDVQQLAMQPEYERLRICCSF